MKKRTKSQIGKASQKKGKYYEDQSAKYWSKELEGEIIRNPGSGKIIGLPGDLLDKGYKNTILKDFVVDVKAEEGIMSKKMVDYYQKTKEDAEGKPCFLEIYDGIKSGSIPQVYILTERRYFCRILQELQGYRREHE